MLKNIFSECFFLLVVQEKFFVFADLITEITSTDHPSFNVSLTG